MPFAMLYKIKPFVACVFALVIKNWIIVTKYISHSLKHFHINFLNYHSHNKNPNTMHFYCDFSTYFFEHEFFSYISYILIHLVSQSVMGGNWARIGHGHEHGRDWAQARAGLSMDWAWADCVQMSRVPTSIYIFINILVCKLSKFSYSFTFISSSITTLLIIFHIHYYFHVTFMPHKWGKKLNNLILYQNTNKIKGANIYNEQNHPFFLLSQGAKMQRTRIWF
jgi:hypothetical protein